MALVQNGPGAKVDGKECWDDHTGYLKKLNALIRSLFERRKPNFQGG